MTRTQPKADPAKALQVLHRGDSSYPGYAVCKRTLRRTDLGTVLEIVTEGLTYRQALDAVDPLPADHLVCLMVGAYR